MEKAFFELFPELEGDMETFNAAVGGGVGKAFGDLSNSSDGRHRSFAEPGGMDILEGMPCV